MGIAQTGSGSSKSGSPGVAHFKTHMGFFRAFLLLLATLLHPHAPCWERSI